MSIPEPDIGDDAMGTQQMGRTRPVDAARRLGTRANITDTHRDAPTQFPYITSVVLVVLAVVVAAPCYLCRLSDILADHER